MSTFSQARAVLLAAYIPLLLMLNAGCGGGGSPVIPPLDPVTIDRNVTLESLTISPGHVTTITGDSTVTITGNAIIDGTLRSTSGPIRLHVMGDLQVSGLLSSRDTSPAGDASKPMRQQGSGVFVLVDGDVEIAATANLESTGHLVLTDDSEQLDRTPTDIRAEINSLPTGMSGLVLADPSGAVQSLPRSSAVFARHLSQTGGATVSIGGHWNSDLTTNIDAAVMQIRFEHAATVTLNEWEYVPPATKSWPDLEGDSEEVLTGQGGALPLDQQIWATAPIRINGAPEATGQRLAQQGGSPPLNVTILQTADGGHGQNALRAGRVGTGGPGTAPGHLQLVSADSLNAEGLILILKPGRGGGGGNASVLGIVPGVDGCPGGMGRDGEANAGIGGDNKQAIVRFGNLDGFTEVRVDDVIAGGGGGAAANGGDGGNGGACCSCNRAGNSIARGGKGGDAELALTGAFTMPLERRVAGGPGGDAAAFGGTGGRGGDCDHGAAGRGGDGGTPNATGGGGGSASTNATHTLQGGKAGNAGAQGGDGGNGGDTDDGTPGAGGGGGIALATLMPPGAPNGVAGMTTEISGTNGQPGQKKISNQDGLVLRFRFAIETEGIVPFGTYGGVVEDSLGAPVGSFSYELIQSNEFSQIFTQIVPFPRLGLGAGQVRIKLDSIMLTDETSRGRLKAVTLVPYSAADISETRPLSFDVGNASGSLIGGPSIFATEILDNSLHPDNPEKQIRSLESPVAATYWDLIAPPMTQLYLIRLEATFEENPPI